MTKDKIILEKGMTGWLVTSRGTLAAASVVHTSNSKAGVCNSAGSLAVFVNRHAVTMVDGSTAYAEAVEGYNHPRQWFYLSQDAARLRAYELYLDSKRYDAARLRAYELYLDSKRYDVEMWIRKCPLETIARLLEIMKEEENGSHLSRTEEH